MSGRRFLLLLAGFVVATGAAAAGGSPYVIQGDRQAGPVRLASSNFPQVAAVLGRQGTHVARRGQSSCAVTWPRIGLTVEFGLIGSDRRDPCKAGGAFVVTVTARAAWRTAVGLRVGDPVARLRRLYPSASRRADVAGRAGFWLVTRRLCREVGGGAYPGLFARVSGGRVSALVATVGICD